MEVHRRWCQSLSRLRSRSDCVPLSVTMMSVVWFFRLLLVRVYCLCDMLNDVIGRSRPLSAEQLGRNTFKAVLLP